MVVGRISQLIGNKENLPTVSYVSRCTEKNIKGENTMKRKASLLLAGALTVSILAGCGVQSSTQTTAAAGPAAAAADTAGQTEAQGTGDAGKSTEDTKNSSQQGGEIIGDAGNAEIQISLCDSQPESSLIGQAEKKFGEYLAEASGGRIALKYYPSAMLGDGTTCMQQVQLGSLDMYRCDAAVLYDWGVESMKIPGLPYLFGSQEQAFEVMSSDIGEQWLKDIDNAGIGMVGVGYLVDMPRCFFTADKPVYKLEDLKGIKIRSLEGDVFMEYKSSLGMPWSEVYTSLSTGVIDAAANTLDSFVSNKMNEVCKYFINNDGMYLVCPMVFSEVTWNKLSPEDQQIVAECWNKASQYYIDQSEGLIEKEVADMEAAGVTFCDIEDMDRWIEATQPVVDKFSTGYEDVVAEIRGQWLNK